MLGGVIDPAQRPELVIGLVTPVGTNTADFAESIRAALSSWSYRSVVLKLSALIPSPAGALDEPEDRRIKRLIAAGDAFCKENNEDPAALARLAVRAIREARVALHREDGGTDAADQLAEMARPSTAYIIHSLKRPAEVELLRKIYGQQFLLFGSQGTVGERELNLLGRQLSVANDLAKHQLARELMAIDASEDEALGQRVNETYPLADFFIHSGGPSRVCDLLFGKPIAPEIGEYAMYLAFVSSTRSLAQSRKVGASLVREDTIIGLGYNDVPTGETPDVIEGHDTSESFKRSTVADTMSRLKLGGFLESRYLTMPDDELTNAGLATLADGRLLAVIEYQRAVHAEARAFDDSACKGLSPKDGDLYVTTYPCHLCYKQALSSRVKQIYFDPYPKSLALAMYPDSGERLLSPYQGVAPRRYISLFGDRPAFKADTAGQFVSPEPGVAVPLVIPTVQDEERANVERIAVGELDVKYQ